MNKISVIIPVYNTADYLERCINSVLVQSIRDFEIILVDDGSTDDSVAICDKYEKEYEFYIKVFHQQNKGVGAARNIGLEYASGNFIFFLDSDDWIDSDTLERLLNASMNFDADIAIGSVLKVNDNGQTHKIIEHLPTDQVLSPWMNSEILFVLPTVCCKLFKKNNLEKVNAKFSSVSIAEDMQFLLKVFAKTESIVYVKEPKYYYFQREDSAMHSIDCMKNLDVLKAFDELISFYENQGVFDFFSMELEFLANRHIFLDASVRVLKINKNSSILLIIQQWTSKRFPYFGSNKYLNRFTLKERIIFELLKKKRYNEIVFIFQLMETLKNQFIISR